MSKRKFNRTSQAPMQFIMVGSGDQALATGALLTGGNSVNILNGQFGVLSTDYNGVTASNNFITAGQTTQNVKSIKVLRGTPNSADLAAVSPFRLGHQKYLATNEIHPQDIVEVTTTLPEVSRYSSVYHTGFSAPAVGTDYDLVITQESVENDIEYAAQRLNTRLYSVTATNPAPVAPIDEVLQNLGLQANAESVLSNPSGESFVVLGIDSTAAATGVVISTIAAGTVIPAYILDGKQTNFIANIEFVAALQQAIADGVFAGTEKIVNLGSVTPGTATTINGLYVVGLKDRSAVVLDEFTRKNVIVESGVTLSNTKTVASTMRDWVGSGKQWHYEAKRFAKQHLAYFDNWYGSDLMGSITTSPLYITDSEDVFYTSCNITYNTVESHTRNLEQRTPHVLTILLAATITNPTATAAGTYTFATTDTTTVAALNASLGAWLADAYAKWTNHTYEGAATLATPFV